MTAPPDQFPVETLWLGVHKTGTTFLQKSLDLSQAKLRAGGVQYLQLEEFRRRYTRPLLYPGHPDAPALAPEPVAGLRQKLIFDENILAVVQDAPLAGGLYPDAARRARVVADHMGFVRPRLVLGLRAFRSYLPSLFCEAMKSTAFWPFRGFCRTPLGTPSWDDLVGRLSFAFPGSEILIYTAEKLRGRERALLSHVTGLPPEDFTLVSKAERPGFSHQAVLAMEALHATRPALPADVRALDKQFPKGPDAPGYDPWTPQEAAALDLRYAADLARLAQRSNVRFLDPALAGL